MIKIGVLPDIAHDAAGAAGDALADDAFSGLNGNPPDVNGSCAGLANQPVAPVCQQKQRATLGLDEMHNQVERLLDGVLDIEGNGQVAAHFRE